MERLDGGSRAESYDRYPSPEIMPELGAEGMKAGEEAFEKGELRCKECCRKKKKKKNQVLLERNMETSEEEDLWRTKSLTDEDLDELKGCLDLGFGFSYEEIPELRSTLPALELCYSVSQKFLDDRYHPLDSIDSPLANWKISSPGDHPEDVKARLKYWAQAVACTVKLCN